MSEYQWAWLAIVVAAPLMQLALALGMRGWPLPELRSLLGWLLPVWLLVPAPVPGHPGHYAPAFLVFAFEWLFQRPGRPDTAGTILLAATAAALAALLIWRVVKRRRS